MQEEYSQQDICNAWSLSKQTVNSIVSNMVKKGYVYLEMVPGSKNRKFICYFKEEIDKWNCILLRRRVWYMVRIGMENLQPVWYILVAIRFVIMCMSFAMYYVQKKKYMKENIEY